MSLVQLATAKSYLGITDTASDTEITRMIDAASEYLEQSCGRVFSQTTHTQTVISDGSGSVFLTNAPIAFPNYGIDSWVKVSDVLLSEDDFRVYVDRGEIEFVLSVPSCAPIEVQYRGGYSTIPADIVQACLEMIAVFYNKTIAKGVTRETLGSATIQYEAGEAVTPFVADVIALYKLFNLPQ